MRVAPVQVRPLDGPSARAAGLPFDTRSISIGIVPDRPANAGIHDPTGEAVLEVVCEELQLFDPQAASYFAVQKLPENIQALCDPKSDQVLELAKLASSAIGLVPHPQPAVEALSIVFGGVELLEGWHNAALSPLEVRAKSSGLVLKTLSILADGIGYPTLGFLLRVTGSATPLFFAHESRNS